MLKVRIKIFSATDKKTEIGRFLYVEQQPVKAIRDVKKDIEKNFFSSLGIKNHIVSITDKDGYVLTNCLHAGTLVGEKVHLYICSATCSACKAKQAKKTSDERKQEVVAHPAKSTPTKDVQVVEKEPTNPITIHVDIPCKSKPEKNIVPLSQLKKASTILGLPKRKLSTFPSKDKKIQKETTLSISSVGASTQINSEKESPAASPIETISSSTDKTISKNSDNMDINAKKSTSSSDNGSGTLSECDEESVYTEASDSDNFHSSTSTHAMSSEECGSDSSTGRKYVRKGMSNVKPLRMVKAPLNRYSKRK